MLLSDRLEPRRNARSTGLQKTALLEMPVASLRAGHKSGQLSGKRYRDKLKRVLDIALVIMFAPIWGAILLAAFLLIALDGGRPFYVQERVGRHGRRFRMIKLRTMVPDADARLAAHLAACPAAGEEWARDQKLRDDPRITRVGRFLRQTSIDELPQVINVLTGDMSLVGPRPFTPDQLKLYTGTGYFALRPGLTGLWQIKERSNGPFARRVMFDEAYLRSLSLLTDLSIMAKTLAVVVRRTGC